MKSVLNTICNSKKFLLIYQLATKFGSLNPMLSHSVSYFYHSYNFFAIKIPISFKLFLKISFEFTKLK